MALLSSLMIIRTLSVAHLTLAFFFLTAPRLIAEQNIVVILGASMHLVRLNSFPTLAYIGFDPCVMFSRSRRGSINPQILQRLLPLSLLS